MSQDKSKERHPHPAKAAQLRAQHPTTLQNGFQPHRAASALAKSPHPATVAQARTRHAATLTPVKRAHAAKPSGSVASNAALPFVLQRMEGREHASSIDVSGEEKSGKEIPVTTLEDGRKIVFLPDTGMVYLCSADGTRLAHVQIAEQREANFLMVHTHTDATDLGVGGMGYMAALSEAAMFVIANAYGDWQCVLMAPAVGAATKGLVSILCKNLLVLYSDGTVRSNKSKVDVSLDLAADIRRQRKSHQYSPSGENTWDPVFSLETAYELQLLCLMEAELHTGLSIFGSCSGTVGLIVGDGVSSGKLQWQTHGPLGALAWWRDATKGGQGRLEFAVPMKLLKSLLPWWAKASGFVWKLRYL